MAVGHESDSSDEMVADSLDFERVEMLGLENSEGMQEIQKNDSHSFRPKKRETLYDDLAVIIVPHSFIDEISSDGRRIVKALSEMHKPEPSKHANSVKEKVKPTPPKPQRKKTHKLWVRGQTILRNEHLVRSAASKKFFHRRKRLAFAPSLFRRFCDKLLFRKVAYLLPLNSKYNVLQTDENDETESWVKHNSFSGDGTEVFNWATINESGWERKESDIRLTVDETILIHSEILPKYRKIIPELSRRNFKSLSPINLSSVSKKRILTRRLLVKPLHRITEYRPGINRTWGKMKGVTAGTHGISRPSKIPVLTKNTEMSLYHIDQKSFESSYGNSNFKPPYVVFVHSPANGTKIRKIYGSSD